MTFWKLKGNETREPAISYAVLFFIMMEVFSRMLKRVERANLLCGFRVDGRRGGGECVSHILLADDTILFFDADVEQILHVRMPLLCF